VDFGVDAFVVLWGERVLKFRTVLWVGENKVKNVDGRVGCVG